jgi:hypothetical protein
MQKKMFAAALAAALGWSQAANAVTLPIGSSAPLVVNFDLSGYAAQPPFDVLNLTLKTTGGTDPSSAVWVELYGGLNGQEAIGYTGVPGGFWWHGNATLNYRSDPDLAPLLDGKLSVGLYASGKVDLASVSAQGLTFSPAFGITPLQTVTLTSAVPEPTQASLLGAGLLLIAGIAAARRARR